MTLLANCLASQCDRARAARLARILVSAARSRVGRPLRARVRHAGVAALRAVVTFCAIAAAPGVGLLRCGSKAASGASFVIRSASGAVRPDGARPASGFGTRADAAEEAPRRTSPRHGAPDRAEVAGLALGWSHGGRLIAHKARLDVGSGRNQRFGGSRGSPPAPASWPHGSSVAPGRGAQPGSRRRLRGGRAGERHDPLKMGL